jgi:hypothetical protein
MGPVHFHFHFHFVILCLSSTRIVVALSSQIAEMFERPLNLQMVTGKKVCKVVIEAERKDIILEM